MKLVTAVSILWAMIAVVTGYAGNHFLHRWWQQQHSSRLLGVADLAAGICTTRTWRTPWESDPAWEQLEQQLGVELVPIQSVRRSPGRSATSPADGRQSRKSRQEAFSPSAVPRQQATAGGSAEFGDLGNSIPIQWTRLSQGAWRASLIVPLPGKTAPNNLGDGAQGALQNTSGTAVSARSLRVTDEIDEGHLSNIWWLSWSATHAVSGAFLIGLLFARNRNSARQRRTLGPWMKVLQEPTITQRSDELLPEPETPPAEMEVQLRITREVVNDLVAKLNSAVERNELVLGNLREGVLAVDESSRVLHANNAVFRLLQLSAESYLYRPLLEVIRVPAVTSLVKTVLKDGRQQEETIELPGHDKILRLGARPLPLDAGRSGALLTVRDETMIKRIEAIRRDFVTNASHELKTPLAAIRAYAETLQLGALEDRESAEQFVAHIIAQADRITSIIQGMLQLSRVQSGRGLSLEQFDAVGAFRPCLTAAEALARSKSIELSVGYSATEDAASDQASIKPPQIEIQSDKDGFQTICSNLLSNAIRYTPEGGAVRTKLFTAGNQLVLEVSDTGIGIKKDDLQRIFERFYRAEKDRNAESGGTGLGLSIVKHLIQALGGTIDVISEPEKGSCFTVSLPIVSRSL